MGEWEDCFGGGCIEWYPDPEPWDPCDDCRDKYKNKCKHCYLKGSFRRWAVRPFKTEEKKGRLKDIATELVKTKDKIKKLEKIEKELKSDLCSLLSKGSWVLVESPSDYNKQYIVEKVSYRPPSMLKKELALQLIKKDAGEDLANKVEEQCSYSKKHRDTIYVRPYFTGQSYSPYEEDDESSDSEEVDYVPF